MGRTPLWQQLGLAYDSRSAGIVAIAENEAAVNPGKPVLSGEAVLHLIEVLRATERRLTVERIGSILRAEAERSYLRRVPIGSIEVVLTAAIAPNFLQEADDLATADVDEERRDG